MAQMFFFESEGEEYGPVSGEQLKAAASDGRLKRTGRIRKEGGQNWTPASQVKRLFPDGHEQVRAAAGHVEKATKTACKVANATGKVADAVKDVAEAGDKVGQAFTAVAGLSAGGSTLLGGVGDFLRPLGPVNVMVFTAAVLSAAVLYFAARRKGARVKVRLKMGTVVSLVVAVIFGLWSGMGAVAGKGDRGVLASNISAVERAQAAVLPVKELPVARPVPLVQDEEGVGEVRRFAVPPAVWSWTAFSQDGKRILYCGLSPSLRDNPRNQNWFVEWDWREGKELRRIALPSERLGDASFSADWKMLLLSPVASKDPLLMWDVEAGREALRLIQPGTIFTHSVLCPDGLHAVRGGIDGLVLVEVGTRLVARRFAGPPEPGKAYRLAVSRDGRLLYTSGAGFPSRLWDVGTGEVLREFAFKQQDVARPAFSPDGKFVLHGGKGEVRLWDVGTGKAAGSFDGLDQYLSAAFSPDGRLMLTADLQLGEAGGLRVWDVAGRKEIVRLKGHAGHGPEGVGFSPDGKYAVSSSQDGTVRVWRLPKAGAVAKAIPAEDEFAKLTTRLGDLKNWTGAGTNNWQSVPGGFVGRGLDNPRFDASLPEDFALSFDLKVLGGMRPQVFVRGNGWEIQVLPKEGDPAKLDVRSRYWGPQAASPALVNLSSVPIPYKPDVATRIRFVFAGEGIECWIGGKPAAKATRKGRGRPQIEVSCWDKGLVEFTNFKVTPP